MSLQRWGQSVGLIVSSKWLPVSFLPLPPSFSMPLLWSSCFIVIFFSLFDLIWTTQLRSSSLHSIGGLALFSFLPSLMRPLYLALELHFLGLEDLRPHARAGGTVSWARACVVGCKDLDFALPQSLLKCSASRFDLGTLALCRSEDMGDFFSLTLDYPSNLRRW